MYRLPPQAAFRHHSMLRQLARPLVTKPQTVVAPPAVFSPISVRAMLDRVFRQFAQDTPLIIGEVLPGAGQVKALAIELLRRLLSAGPRDPQTLLQAHDLTKIIADANALMRNATLSEREKPALVIPVNVGTALTKGNDATKRDVQDFLNHFRPDGRIQSEPVIVTLLTGQHAVSDVDFRQKFTHITGLPFTPDNFLMWREALTRNSLNITYLPEGHHSISRYVELGLGLGERPFVLVVGQRVTTTLPLAMVDIAFFPFMEGRTKAEENARFATTLALFLPFIRIRFANGTLPATATDSAEKVASRILELSAHFGMTQRAIEYTRTAPAKPLIPSVKNPNLDGGKVSNSVGRMALITVGEGKMLRKEAELMQVLSALWYQVIVRSLGWEGSIGVQMGGDYDAKTGEYAIVAQFLPGKSMDALFKESRDDINLIAQKLQGVSMDNLLQIAVVDYISGQPRGTKGNLVLTHDGKMVPIDNESSLKRTSESQWGYPILKGFPAILLIILIKKGGEAELKLADQILNSESPLSHLENCLSMIQDLPIPQWSSKGFELAEDVASLFPKGGVMGALQRLWGLCTVSTERTPTLGDVLGVSDVARKLRNRVY